MAHDTGKPEPATPAEVRSNVADALRYVGRVCVRLGGATPEDDRLAQLTALADDFEARP